MYLFCVFVFITISQIITYDSNLRKNNKTINLAMVSIERNVQEPFKIDGIAPIAPMVKSRKASLKVVIRSDLI